MYNTATLDEAFQLKGRLFTLTVIQLFQDNIEYFRGHLRHICAAAPKLFIHAPVILDLESVQEKTIDFDGLLRALRDEQIIPVGVQGGTQAQHQQALKAGLAVMKVPSNTKTDMQLVSGSAKTASPSNKSAEEKKPVAPNKTKIVDKPVRSGQQIYAQDSDLIVMASVSHGAELLADGNIHVYGHLRGRALAGVKGDDSARIFCQRLEAELVSINGQYMIDERISSLDLKGPQQIYIDQAKLRIAPL